MPPHDLIDDYLAHLRSESSSERTIQDRRRILTCMHKDLPYGLYEACTDELKAWLWRDGLAMSSRETYYGAFNSFFAWAYSEGVLDFDPAALIKRPKPPQRLPNPVTDEQLAEALERACEPVLLWVKLAAYAGLRCIDIEHLHRERITQQVIHVVQSKGGTARIVPTHPIVWEAVADLPAGPLTDLNARQISMKGWTYFHRNLHMHGVRMHRFRHWFGTMIQRLYKDILVTQRLLGHASPATTAGYVLVAAEQTRAAVDLLPRFDAVAFAA
jgi:integrase/recombinase XerC